MQIRALESQEKINIKKLNLESPEKREELSFDPEKEITDEEWESAVELINHSLNNDVPPATNLTAHGLARSMKILFPDRFGALGLENKLFNNLKTSIELLESKKEPIFTEIYNAKILFPEKFRRIQINFLNNIIEDVRDEISLSFKLDNGEAGIELAKKLKVIMPEKLEIKNSNDKKLQEDIWQIGVKILENSPKKQFGWSFDEKAAALKIIFPERISELNINKDIWKNMKETLNIFRNKDLLFSLFEHAANMKILAAEEVKITDQGLEIIMPKPKPDFKEKKEPMPEIRKF